MRKVPALVLFALILLGVGCGGTTGGDRGVAGNGGTDGSGGSGGASGGGGEDPTIGNLWDKMEWDRGSWD